MKAGFRHTALSLTLFVIVLGALVSVDERVRDRFTSLLSGGNGVSGLGSQASELGSALLTAVRHQSIENAPLLVFATVGAVLFLFMVRS